MDVAFREAQPSDIPEMAEIRAADWGTKEYWEERIRHYLFGDLNPREALPSRVAFVCIESNRVLGLIAGHLTHRFGCDGELEWISVRSECRNRGIAGQLLALLTEWFIAHDARRICVDVEPSNQTALRFYAKHGARDLKPHWMVWDNIGQSQLEPPRPNPIDERMRDG